MRSTGGIDQWIGGGVVEMATGAPVAATPALPPTRPKPLFPVRAPLGAAADVVVRYTRPSPARTPVREAFVTTKRALIVDDSKSARVVLSRLLERHELAVDTTESAESALVYLQQHTPDVIFMDHVMSGMDGLQAVQAIKRDPRTAEIPILMYTSQDGEVYAGEARASGAAGVLPKLLAPTDIAKMLHALELLPAAAATAFEPVPLATGPAAMPASTVEVAALDARADVTAPVIAPVPPLLAAADVHGIVEPLLKEHVGDLRRFMVASLESTSVRLASDLAAQIQAAIAAVAPPPPVPVVVAEPLPPPFPPRPVAWIAVAVVGCLAALVAAALAWQQHQQIAALGVRLEQQASVLAASRREIEAARGALPVAAVPVPAGSAAQRLTVPYGEPAFAAPRLATLVTRVAELSKTGFVGTVRVTTVSGDFCLTGNPAEGYALAPAEMPANRCDVVGNPYEESLRPADREPPALATLATTTRDRSHGAVELGVVHGPRPPSTDYPHDPDATAAQWNAVALAHNYVEILALPRAGGP